MYYVFLQRFFQILTHLHFTRNKMSFTNDCKKRLEKNWCQSDAQCRSALYNMYDCNSCATCGIDTISDAGGLAWTSSGLGALQCTTTSGNPVYCDKKAERCRYGINEYETYAGIVEHT